MTARTARLVLAAIVVATTLVAIRYHPGLDFINQVWAPIRGLSDGLNPYDPSNAAYLERFQYPFRSPVFAAPYIPAALTLFAPLALLTQDHAVDVMAVLNAGFLWAGILLLIPPRDARGCLVASVAGAAVTLTSPFQITMDLGQFSACAFAGLALFVASLNRNPLSAWLPACGAALVSLKPQSALPVAAALAILGLWRVLARTVFLLALASLPWVILLFRTLTSPAEIFRVARDNIAAYSLISTDDVANPINLRIDALGLIAHLRGPALVGLVPLFAAFLVATVLLVWAVRRGYVSGGPSPLADPWGVTLLGLYIVSAHYHLVYDQLLLYVGPLLAIGLRWGAGSRDGPVDSRTRVLAGAGIALLVTGIAFRTGPFNWMLDHGVPLLAMWVPWVVLPSLISIGAVVWRLRQARVTSMATAR